MILRQSQILMIQSLNQILFYTETMLINTETKLYPNEARINIKERKRRA